MSHRPNYARLEEVLSELGYGVEKRPGSHILFRRKGYPSVLLPWKNATEKVDGTRLAGVYQLVSSRGLAVRHRLDELLNAD